MEGNSLRIEYKKFNTFLFDFIKTINQGWLFMKMKHKYAIGTEILFQLKVSDIESLIDIKGTVIYHGLNEEQKEGIGIKIDITNDVRNYLDTIIRDNCIEKYGQLWGTKIMNLITAELT